VQNLQKTPVHLRRNLVESASLAQRRKLVEGFCPRLLESTFLRTPAILATALLSALPALAQAPAPPGKMVDLGSHRLHVNCTGSGSPTVVVENGLGDFSFDWFLVQQQVQKFIRICTYDRAGYAWSDPGPMPRTFAQLNLESHDALAKLGERPPFVLVGHSFGGPVVRNYAAIYPHDVSGMVLVDAAFEGQRVGIGNNKTMKLGADAKGASIPAPHEQIAPGDASSPTRAATIPPETKLDPMYSVLPPEIQKLQLWADVLPALRDAENSQRTWSSEYFAKWLASPQDAALGSIPLLVLTRANGGYDRDLDVPAAQLEKERLAGQAMLVRLSTQGKQISLQCGHNMELEDPAAVSAAIGSVVQTLRASSTKPPR
jgi:pimeloyl-ACP methyl ester carboxylesterase